jgi:hypothetical protein
MSSRWVERVEVNVIEGANYTPFRPAHNTNSHAPPPVRTDTSPAHTATDFSTPIRTFPHRHRLFHTATDFSTPPQTFHTLIRAFPHRHGLFHANTAPVHVNMT